MALGIEIESTRVQDELLFGTASSARNQQDFAGTRYVRVVVERGIESAMDADDVGLLYADPWGDLKAGERVEVPLGRGDKKCAGIVVEACDAGALEHAGKAGKRLDASRIKAVRDRTGGALSPTLLSLATWIASYYICPLGMVVATMTPAAVKQGVGKRRVMMVTRVKREATGEGVDELPKMTKVTREAWERVAALPESAFPMSSSDLMAAAALKTSGAVKRLVALGLLTTAEAFVVKAFGERDAGTEEDATNLVVVAPTVGRLTLTAEQGAAVVGVSKTLGRFQTHLLRGVTGSGKTEVYLRLIEQVLELGQSALVLVPEIALTPQTAARFTSRFGAERVAVMHSGMTSSQRHAAWSRVNSGEIGVVIGARSAVFAPLERIGLIVVDEEHDSSYKQDQLPRYNGRDVAIKRAQLEGCPVVLGSATPSLESWVNCIGDGARSVLWELPRRAGGASMPAVEIVDLREERRARSATGDRTMRLLGPRLESAIHRTLEEKGQVLLLLNRRGFASCIACPDPNCGFILTCDQCDASLVWHKGSHLPAGSVVRCHYCLSEQHLPSLCPACNSRLRTLGGGTQRAEEEIERTFASHGIERDKTLVRVDSDSMRGPGKYHNTLARFASGEIRMLVGTQMIAKGLDFPGVRLVGVIDADTAASMPDFRAGERTFQLVSQVAGRAGRGSVAGRVIVQTMNPNSNAIRRAAAHDYIAFAADELKARRQFGFPPITRMARIVCRDRVYAKAMESARELAETLGAVAGSNAKVQGPLECAISRIAGYYRFEVVITAANAVELQGMLGLLRRRGQLKSDAKTAVDVDPVSAM